MLGHGEEKTNLMQKIKEYGLKNRIIISEPRSDMPQVMSCIDILLFTPYWGEGLPYVVLEAMASGKPVVASHIGSNNELIVDSQTGFLPYPAEWNYETDTLKAEPFVEKIEYLLKNPTIAKEMGLRSRQRAVEKFDLHVMVSKLEKLYLDLLNE